MSREDRLDIYDYILPDERIARAPSSPRDSARLLFYDSKKNASAVDTFLHIDEYLPKNALLVFNDTRVIPARLVVKKETGGAVRLLYISSKKNHIEVLADRKLTLGSTLSLGTKHSFLVVAREEKTYTLKPSFPVAKIFDILHRYGITPLPPYIKNSPLSEKEAREKYQTIFAQRKGSVAAPTASLHFTKRLFKKLHAAGIDTAFLTLHVNLGTFAPVGPHELKKGRLHEEYFEIPARTASILNKAKKEGRPIIAVGTTVVRTLESASDRKGVLKKLSGTTDLFIQPGYAFKFVDGMITNFHVPRSSLMMLVAAFLEEKMARGASQKPAGREKLLELYAEAIERKFEFFSFGDGMLIV